MATTRFVISRHTQFIIISCKCCRHSPEAADTAPSSADRAAKKLAAKEEAERVANSVKKQDAEQQQIVDVPVPMQVEEGVHVPRINPKKRVQHGTVEQIVDIPVLIQKEELVHVPEIPPQELVQHRSLEQSTDVHGPMTEAMPADVAPPTVTEISFSERDAAEITKSELETVTAEKEPSTTATSSKKNRAKKNKSGLTFQDYTLRVNDLRNKKAQSELELTNDEERFFEDVKRGFLTGSKSGTKAPQVVCGFEVGAEVEAHSLQTKTLNRARGRVKGAKGDRVAVSFPDPIGEKALKPANLKLAPCDDSDPESDSSENFEEFTLTQLYHIVDAFIDDFVDQVASGSGLSAGDFSEVAEAVKHSLPAAEEQDGEKPTYTRTQVRKMIKTISEKCLSKLKISLHLKPYDSD